MREKTGGKTDNTKETFSINCTSKRDYDQLTELCNNPETFNKFRNWMKQDKEEKSKNFGNNYSQ